MRNNFTRISKHGICVTTRTPTFENADLFKDGISMEQPHIYAIQDIENEVDLQPTLCEAKPTNLKRPNPGEGLRMTCIFSKMVEA